MSEIDDEHPLPPLSTPPAAGAPPLGRQEPAPPEPSPVTEDTDERPGDPFEEWPAAESAAVIKESPADGASVEHVRGEVDVPAGFTVVEGTPLGHRRSVGVVVSRFNGGVTNRMLRIALDTLLEAGVSQDAITVMPVPGAFELPIGAMALAKTKRYSCVIGLGCVIRGETAHFDYVASEAASGLQLAGLETGVPVTFGVLTVDTIDQARERLGRGGDAARAALEMADIFSQVRAQVRAAG